MDILVGCDPEVFVKQKNIFRSAHGLIKGDKRNPFKIKNGAVQVDGMALEFNIDPAINERDFLKKVVSVYGQLCKMVPDYEVVATPVADFTPEYMKEQPAEAIELGCDPDYNGWTQMENVKPDGDRPFRTASGHVHIGWTQDQDVQNPQQFVAGATIAKQMDFFLGLPSLAYDKDTKRRELYGKAGCFRPKSYGMEYRTLSNVWLSSKNLIAWVYRATKAGMDRFEKEGCLATKYGDIQNIINNSDWKSAKQICLQENIEIPNV